MSLVYHILAKTPATSEEETALEYEELAQKLVASGRLRIDTNYYSNFVRYTDNKYKISTTFSYKELTLEALAPQVEQHIKRVYALYNYKLSQDKLSQMIATLKSKAKRLVPPPPEVALRLARIFVQSAHPIVIHWILLDKVEVFITYSNSIGDTMDIANWKRNGSNSGMQSTDGSNVIIYVSCGGDPFAKNLEQYPKYGDGWAALARMQVIAAQEIGHYADIVRDGRGRQITRHSANFSCSKPKENVAQARKNDITNCINLRNRLRQNGLAQLVETETKIRFYDQQKITSLKTIYLKIRAHIQKKHLLKYGLNNSLIFLKIFYDKEQYMGLMVENMIADMLANLTPGGDVYKSDNKDVEEAIACAESLARVPQQAVKWGHLSTQSTMGSLYVIYYQQVIPSLIESYEQYTGLEFRRNRNKKIYAMGKLQRLIYCAKKKLGYGSEHKFQEVREI